MEPCAARRAGDADSFPRKTPRKDKPLRHGLVFALEDRGRLLVRRRPERGLLGGMLELPGTAWRTGAEGGVWGLEDAAAAHAPLEGPGWRLRGTVSHVFTHFRLELAVVHGQARLDRSAQTVAVGALEDAGLPTVMLKAARLAISGRPR
jgi:A/G-specific adenine glycosylase